MYMEIIRLLRRPVSVRMQYVDDLSLLFVYFENYVLKIYVGLGIMRRDVSFLMKLWPMRSNK